MKPSLFLTLGDENGIGPEVAFKASLRLRQKINKNASSFVCIGNPIGLQKINAPFQTFSFHQIEEAVDFSKKQNSHLALLVPELPSKKVSSLSGYYSGASIELFVKKIYKKFINAVLVTGPISKENLQRGGFPYQGHTDMLAKLTKTKPTMMLKNDQLCVSLVTDHIPLQQVSKALTRGAFDKTLYHTIQFFEQRGKKKGYVDVLALNPHAGENGVLGTEEKKKLIPWIKSYAKKSKLHIYGPHSADSYFFHYFATDKKKRPHAVVAMYHDQGLIPLKTSGFESSINLTLGLPFVRVSVDHGTAFSLAGKNRASEKSMIKAIEYALEV